MRIPSVDGVEVVVHDLGGDPGAPTLLVSHATGFHGRCYTPIADLLRDRWHVLAIDHRGHGATVAPEGWSVDWSGFGADTAAVAHALAPDGGLTAFGHSMGGATLLMAAAGDPGLFTRLVLFEPITFPRPDDYDPESVPLVQGALRRRRRFDSMQDAIDNFGSKPPLSAMTADALRCYVEYGFAPAADGGVELRCSPEFEAATFRASFNSTWDELPGIGTEVVVVSGRVVPDQPSARCRAIADRLGHATYVELPEMNHFGPFSHPATLAALL